MRVGGAGAMDIQQCCSYVAAGGGCRRTGYTTTIIFNPKGGCAWGSAGACGGGFGVLDLGSLDRSAEPTQGFCV
jgi:hypothetical protein